MTTTNVYGQPYPFPTGTIPSKTNSLVLPRQRMPKWDVAIALAITLSGLGCKNNIQDPTVSKELWQTYIVASGSFHQSMIKSPEYGQRPVITVSLAGQRTERMGIGGVIGQFTQSVAPTMSDPAPSPGTEPIVIPDGYPATTLGKFKYTNVVVAIHDTNMMNADRMASLVGSCMDGIIEGALINQLGYQSCLETAYDEEESVVSPDEATPFFVYTRTLTYEANWNSIIVNADTLVNVVEQIFTDQGGGAGASEFTRVNDDTPPPNPLTPWAPP